ncbi:unnamed protein product, partial [Polarella glacialis]
ERPPPWLLRFTGGEGSHTANLFCSLMSTVFTYDPIGWGVPYGGSFSSGSEEDLVDVALQVLCVVMDFSSAEDAEADADSDEEDGEVSGERYLVDNSQLQANSVGLGFRSKKQLDQLVASKTAIWGEVMNGTDEGDGWLKVGRYFLPMIINGTPVLTQCADSAHQASRAPAALKKPRKPRNVYRYMLQNITKDGEIDLVFNGLVRLLSTVYK